MGLFLHDTSTPRVTVAAFVAAHAGLLQLHPGHDSSSPLWLLVTLQCFLIMRFRCMPSSESLLDLLERAFFAHFGRNQPVSDCAVVVPPVAFVTAKIVPCVHVHCHSRLFVEPNALCYIFLSRNPHGGMPLPVDKLCGFGPQIDCSLRVLSQSKSSMNIHIPEKIDRVWILLFHPSPIMATIHADQSTLQSS